MMGTSFPEVLERTRDGDPSAFAVLWREYQPALLRYLRVTAHEAAEDVASETWASVTASITKFDGDETAFRAWLFTVARRRAIDHFRSEARRPSVPTDPVVLGSVAPAAGDPDPADANVSTLALESALELCVGLDSGGERVPPGAQREAPVRGDAGGVGGEHVIERLDGTGEPERVEQGDTLLECRPCGGCARRLEVHRPQVRGVVARSLGSERGRQEREGCEEGARHEPSPRVVISCRQT